jgi:peptidylprolyl isomerase
MPRNILLAASLLLAAAAPPPSLPISASQQIVNAAPTSAWQPIPDDDLLVMDLAGGKRVIIQLAPSFAPVHVANIRTLAHAGWWTHASIVRVQDNYVVQWSNPRPRVPLPKTLVASPPAEYERPAGAIQKLPFPDSYAPTIGFADGWPVGSDGKTEWLAHCYGMVGVGRDMPPDTGTGAELYAVIGQAPRHLDRNIALVGRVLDGMPALSALPRGTAPLGFYPTPGERTKILRITLAADLPPAQRPHYEMLQTTTPSFAAYLAARANRRDAFFVRPAGAVDLCNVPVPVRPVTPPK